MVHHTVIKLISRQSMQNLCNLLGISSVRAVKGSIRGFRRALGVPCPGGRGNTAGSPVKCRPPAPALLSRLSLPLEQPNSSSLTQPGRWQVHDSVARYLHKWPQKNCEVKKYVCRNPWNIANQDDIPDNILQSNMFANFEQNTLICLSQIFWRIHWYSLSYFSFLKQLFSSTKYLIYPFSHT